jgi:hypothetical protein
MRQATPRARPRGTVEWMTITGRWATVTRQYARGHVLSIYDRAPTPDKERQLNERLRGATVRQLLNERDRQHRSEASQRGRIPSAEQTRAWLARHYPEYYPQPRAVQNASAVDTRYKQLELGGGEIL